MTAFFTGRAAQTSASHDPFRKHGTPSFAHFAKGGWRRCRYHGVRCDVASFSWSGLRRITVDLAIRDIERDEGETPHLLILRLERRALSQQLGSRPLQTAQRTEALIFLGWASPPRQIG